MPVLRLIGEGSSSLIQTVHFEVPRTCRTVLLQQNKTEDESIGSILAILLRVNRAQDDSSS